MDLGLRERVAIVAGSSRGVGRAIALALAREGASVTICARTEAALRRAEIELARTASQNHVLAIPADLSVPRDIRRVARDTFNRFGQIGILVTHTSNLPVGRPSDFDDETMTAALERNFLGAVRLIREVVPYMKQQSWGRIINLLSTSVRQATEGLVLSSSSQGALLVYSKTLANELAPFNITVNNVLPGFIETETLTSLLESRAEQQSRPTYEVMQETIARIPLRRLGKPEEVGDLVAFLASERAEYITGASIVVDGGLLQSIE